MGNDSAGTNRQCQSYTGTPHAEGALAKLIDNALQHGPVGTHITVRVGPGWVEVEDDGPGIAPEHQAHVFERFYRAAPAGVTGSGLGLAIVKEIASQHGAHLRVTSPVLQGRGTVVRMDYRTQHSAA